MADLVNPVSAAQLAPRNQEPTHLTGASWDDLGGTGTDSQPNSVKVNASAGVKSGDTTIPKAVSAEPTHLSVKTEEDDEPEVKFDDDDEPKLDEADDLDKALDDLDDEPSDVKVNESDDEDEDDKDDIKEEDGDDDEDDKPAFLKKEEKEDDEDDLKEDDDKDADDKEDDDKPAFLKKEEKEDDEDDLKEDDDEDADDEKKDVTESVIRVKVALPKAKLFESAGFTGAQQKQVATLFESAVRATAKSMSKQFNEHYKARYARKAALTEKKLVNRLDTYLSVVVESWLDANKMAVRQSLRADLAENFLTGLQTLFREHYIDVPESKVNVVETLQREVETLKGQINEQHATNLKLRRLAEAANKKRIVAEFARPMSEAQAAKLAKLAENTEYVDAKDFRAKLTMLKESYFSEKGDRKVTRLPEEDVKVVKEEVAGKSEADLVADAITRQVKSAW